MPEMSGKWKWNPMKTNNLIYIIKKNLPLPPYRILIYAPGYRSEVQKSGCHARIDDVTLPDQEIIIFWTCNGVLGGVGQRIQTFLTAGTGCTFSLSSFKVYSDQGCSLPLFYLKQRGINLWVNYTVRPIKLWNRKTRFRQSLACSFHANCFTSCLKTQLLIFNF